VVAQRTWLGNLGIEISTTDRLTKYEEARRDVKRGQNLEAETEAEARATRSRSRSRPKIRGQGYEVKANFSR